MIEAPLNWRLTKSLLLSWRQSWFTLIGNWLIWKNHLFTRSTWASTLSPDPSSAALSLVLPIHISVLWYLSVLVSCCVDFLWASWRKHISLKATASYTLLGLHAATVWKKLLALLSLRQLHARVSRLYSQTELCGWGEHINDRHTANNWYNSLKHERLAHRAWPHIKGLIPAMLWSFVNRVLQSWIEFYYHHIYTWILTVIHKPILSFLSLFAKL